MTDAVCVVGAGPAGLAMARALKQKDVTFEVFEKNPGVGGIWNPAFAGSPMYDSAHFISSRDAPTSTFRGHPFPPDTATYPGHAEVLAYLQRFADAEGLMQHIHLSTSVAHAEWTGTAWRVYAGDRVRDYAALVCASGTLWDPVVPGFVGADTFGGTIRHAVTYRSADEVGGKRVLVIGAGNSGVDIACDVARTAASVSLSMRRGYWFVPKFIAGLPADIFFRRRDGLPDWVHPPDVAALLKFLVGAPESYGLQAPDHPPFAAHPIMNSEVLHHMGHGRIRPRRGIARLERGAVVYTDSTREVIDEIILATGYRASVPYLAKDTFEYDGGNRPNLWMRLFHPARPALYGLGFLETNSSVYRLFDLGAELIAGHIAAKLQNHPAAATLDAEIASGVEPDMSNGMQRIGSERHVGYVDSRVYEAAVTALIVEHFGMTADVVL